MSSPQSRSSLYLVDGGCLILSRAKIVAESSTIFSPGMMSDRLAAKGAIYAKLNPKPGVFIHLFVTHLQAVYAGTDTMAECLDAQKSQYDELVEFVASTVAANESHEDMYRARGLLDKKRRRQKSDISGITTPPEQDTMSFLSQKSRRWPILITGDFNCNSRTEGTPTKQYRDLTNALSKLGNCSDVLYDTLGEHPVTYAAANVKSDGSFTPVETALTCPEDYLDDGKWVNQSLDYLFLLPPTHENLLAPLGLPPVNVVIGTPVADQDIKPIDLSPDSRILSQSLITPTDTRVQHLEYVPNGHPRAPQKGTLKYLSDHLAVQTVLSISASESL